MSVFDAAFDFLIKNEGSTYTNNPNDSGGPTKYGITLKTLSDWAGKLIEISEVNVKNLSADTAKQIYFTRYWKPLSCHKLSDSRVAIAIFDSAVLYGPGVAAGLAQKSVNDCSGNVLKVDGFLGEETVKMINAIPPERFIIAFHHQICNRIESVTSATPKNEVFKQGWLNRADRLLSIEKVS